jgi:AcrR family transcriptional regulator
MDELAARAGVSRATLYRLVGSREALIRDLHLPAAPTSRERILEAALALLARDGLARLSLDEVAQRAGVSRAALYRQFPGRAPLFREMVRRHSPMEAVARVLDAAGDLAPAEVLPAVARAASESLAGRVGILRAVMLEISGEDPDAADAAHMVLERLVAPLAGYLARQMQAGRLRPMHPLVALQSFIGPIVFHHLTREVVESRLGPVPEDTVIQMTDLWLRAMDAEDQR